MVDHYERIENITLDKFIPFKVDWELTYRCNLKCSHCYQSGPDSREELKTEEIFSILDQLADAGCLYITFTGGEILLRKDFFEIARYANKKEFALRLFTNGTLIDESIADKIKALNPLGVEISLYSADPTVHEEITGVKGSFERTTSAISFLHTRKINVITKCTFFKENILGFDRLKELTRSMGTGFNFSFTLIPKIDGSKGLLDLRLSRDQLSEVFTSRNWLVNDIDKGGVQVFEPLCAAGFNSLYISPYGEVFPCVVLRQECGSLKDKPLKEIWQAPFFKKLRSVKFENLSECFNCGLSGYCDRCAGLAWMEKGDLFGVSPHDCSMAEARKLTLDQRRS